MNQALVGGDIHRLVSQWGPPFTVVENGRQRIYEWRWSGGAVAQSYRVGRGAFATSREVLCRRWYDVDDTDRIVGWHVEGDC